MIDVADIPADLVGRPEGEYELAQGPFVVLHNGELELGAHLERNGDELMIWNGGRSYVLDDSYTVEVFGDELQFYSKKYKSSMILRPLTLEDASWAVQEELGITDINEFKGEILGMLDAGGW